MMNRETFCKTSLETVGKGTVRRLGKTAALVTPKNG